MHRRVQAQVLIRVVAGHPTQVVVVFVQLVVRLKLGVVEPVLLEVAYLWTHLGEALGRCGGVAHVGDCDLALVIVLGRLLVLKGDQFALGF